MKSRLKTEGAQPSRAFEVGMSLKHCVSGEGAELPALLKMTVIKA